MPVKDRPVHATASLATVSTLLLTAAAAADQLGLQITTPDFSNGYVLHDGTILQGTEKSVGELWETFSQEWTVTRLWLTMDEMPTFNLSAGIGGSEQFGPLILDPGDNGVFFNAEFGADTPVIAAFHEFFPETAFDTYLTVGAAAGPVNISISNLNGELDGAINCDDCGWSDFAVEPELFLPQEYGGYRLLLGQFTTRTPHAGMVAGLVGSFALGVEYESFAGVPAVCCVGSRFADCNIQNFIGGFSNANSSDCMYSLATPFDQASTRIWTTASETGLWRDRLRPGINCVSPDLDFPACEPSAPKTVRMFSSPSTHAFSDACPLPPGFFARDSDEFSRVVNLCMDSVFFQWEDDPFALCDPISEKEVQITITLDSVAYGVDRPISVSLNDHSEFQDWYVYVTTGSPLAGTVTARKTHCNGGTFDLEVTFCPEFRFTRGDEERMWSYCDDCDPAGVLFTLVDQPWSMFSGEHAIEVNGGDGKFCTLFHPGFETLDPQTTDCDCPCFADCAPPDGGDGNVDIDDILAVVGAISTQDPRCDITPINANGLPGNGTVNIDDILTTIDSFGPCPTMN